MSDETVVIRKAQEGEGPTITQVALLSKAHWGYDRDFLDKCIQDLTVDAEYIMKNPVYVAIAADNIVGFYSIILEDDGYYLDNMFILPEYIGKGLGKSLWGHMLEVFSAMKVQAFKLVADPFAAGFYSAMGAVQIYEKESSTFPGRKLPVMQYHFL